MEQIRKSASQIFLKLLIVKSINFKTKTKNCILKLTEMRKSLMDRSLSMINRNPVRLSIQRRRKSHLRIFIKSLRAEEVVITCVKQLVLQIPLLMEC